MGGLLGEVKWFYLFLLLQLRIFKSNQLSVPGSGEGRRGPTKRPQLFSDIVQPPFLCLITPEGLCTEKYSEEAKRIILSRIGLAVEGGVSLVQLRDKTATREELATMGKRIRDVVDRSSAIFMVNGDLDVAIACKADGVHLPEAQVQDFINSYKNKKFNGVLGCSVHSSEAALRAMEVKADYIVVGTMFKTNSHPGKVPEGPESLKKIKLDMLDHSQNTKDSNGAEEKLPLVCGVGGIDGDNCVEVLKNGGDGVAMISTLCFADRPKDKAEEVTGFMAAFLTAYNTVNKIGKKRVDILSPSFSATSQSISEQGIHFNEGAKAVNLTFSEINAMKVAELKDELRKLGLPVSGRKIELSSRLKNAYGLDR